MKIMQNVFVSINSMLLEHSKPIGGPQAARTTHLHNRVLPSQPNPTVPTRSPRLPLPDHLVLLDQGNELCPPGITQVLTLDVKTHGGCTM